MRNLLAGVVVMSIMGCSGGQESSYAWDGSLEALLESRPERFGTVLQDPERYRVQIIYTQIDRDADNVPSFSSYTYRLNETEYFYPASTVKLPAAALALEKLNEVGVAGLDRDTPMLVGDEETGKSVARYAREILLVSDNIAFNRLYDFLGQDRINQRMQEKGFAGTRIMHRLEIALSLEENRSTGPVRFVADGEVVYAEDAVRAEADYAAARPILLGKAEIVGGELQQRPKDFAIKNAYPLQAQHDVVKALMFPDAVPAHRRFNLAEADYRLLYDNMSGYPSKSGMEDYADAEKFPDGYVKFFIYGGDTPSIPGHMRIYNKVGDAYGFLTESAYIVDLENGVEFLLAATIFTNANETFNDDTYEYDTIGLPFLRDLGQSIYEIELQRTRAQRPDFSHLDPVHD